MALRTEKTTLAIVSALVWLTPASFAQEFRYPVRHGKHSGTLSVSNSGLSFEGAHQTFDWPFQEIHQLKLGPKSLTVLTYQNNRWKMGAERQYKFDLEFGDTQNVYPFLKNRLDQRFVAVFAEPEENLLWEIPVKHLLRFSGSDGVLRVGMDAIVFSSESTAQSRTWRFQDISNVSSAGPFQMTITTFERAAAHFGNLKDFNFELKEPLDEARFNALWLQLNQAKGLEVLRSYRETLARE